MAVVHSKSRAERIDRLFDDLIGKLGGLSGQLRNELQQELRELRETVNEFVHTRGEEESAARTKYLRAILAESEARYRELGENLSDPLAVFGPDMRLIYRNPAAEQVSQIPNDIAIGKSFEELYPNLVSADLHEKFLQAFETGQVQTYINHWICPDTGKDCYYEITFYPGRDWLVCMSENVTERVEALEALRRSERFNRQLIESSSDSIKVLDLDGHLLSINSGGLHLLEAENAGAVIGKSWVTFWQEEDQPRVQAAVDAACGGHVGAFQAPRKSFQGKELWWDVVISPIRGMHDKVERLLVISRDITQRKLAEEELRRTSENLRESEERFRAMADGTPVLIWLHNAEGKLEFVNRTWTDYFDVTLDEVKGTGWMPLIHPDDAPGYIDVFRKCSEEHTFFHAQARVRINDGNWRWIESQGQPRFSDTGEFLGMAGSSIDITERIEAEAALAKAHNDLRNERNRLMAVMEALPVGLAIYDENGGIIQANPGYEAVWGSPRPPVNSLSDYEMYKAWWVQTGKRVQPEEWASARSVITGETQIGQYLRIQRFDGTFGYVMNSGAPVRDADGKIIGGAVAIMDITERVDVEKALQESQNRFRVALSSVPLLVYTCDCDQRTTWIYNPPPGYRTEDVLGKRDDEVLPPEDVIELVAAKQQALDTGQGGMHEIRMKYGGEERYYFLTTDPIRNALGEVTGLTCASIDITEQKRMEMERQEVQMKMEVQRRLMDQREKERMGIARDIHDGPIQTLASTAFNIQFLKESYPDPTLTIELNQIALNVKSAVRELREVVNDLRPPSIIRFGLTRAIMMHAEDLRERYPETELELDLEEDGARLSDQACLTVFRVFQEGMNNIFRHAGASKVQVKYSVSGSQFVLELHDNGSGFTVPKDFTNLTIDGHFGLAGMKERVEAVGGTLTIASQPNKGTTITVKGPLAGG